MVQWRHSLSLPLSESCVIFSVMNHVVWNLLWLAARTTLRNSQSASERKLNSCAVMSCTWLRLVLSSICLCRRVKAKCKHNNIASIRNDSALHSQMVVGCSKQITSKGQTEQQSVYLARESTATSHTVQGIQAITKYRMRTLICVMLSSQMR